MQNKSLVNFGRSTESPLLCLPPRLRYGILLQKVNPRFGIPTDTKNPPQKGGAEHLKCASKKQFRKTTVQIKIAANTAGTTTDASGQTKRTGRRNERNLKKSTVTRRRSIIKVTTRSIWKFPGTTYLRIRTWTAFSGTSPELTAETTLIIKAATLTVSWNWMNFWMFA